MKTPRTSKLPPLCTQFMGSLPKLRVVWDLLKRRQEFSPERFGQIMDDLVRFSIRTLGMAGLDVITDGHWRGAHRVEEFFRRVGGLEPMPRVSVRDETRISEAIVRKMNTMGSVYKADADFLVNNTARLTKCAMPCPVGLAMGYWHEEYSREAYPTRQDFLDHLISILTAEMHTLIASGIDILQIDDSELLRLCQPGARAAEGSEWSVDVQIAKTLEAINLLADSGAGKLEIHLRCCTGRARGGGGEGGGGPGPKAALDYKPLLVRLDGVRIDRINLGFTGKNAERIEDLALLPGQMDVGLGVLDVRSAKAQGEEEIRALVKAAAKVVPLRRIALTPDCGSAPAGSETPALDEVYDRLRRLTLTAKSLRAEMC